jgi:hypothetical protein
VNIKKTMTYDIGNPSAGSGHTQKCVWVKPVDGLPTPPISIIASPMAMQIKKNMHRFTSTHTLLYVLRIT